MKIITCDCCHYRCSPYFKDYSKNCPCNECIVKSTCQNRTTETDCEKWENWYYEVMQKIVYSKELLGPKNKEQKK